MESVEKSRCIFVQLTDSWGVYLHLKIYHSFISSTVYCWVGVSLEWRVNNIWALVLVFHQLRWANSKINLYFCFWATHTHIHTHKSTCCFALYEGMCEKWISYAHTIYSKSNDWFISTETTSFFPPHIVTFIDYLFCFSFCQFDSCVKPFRILKTSNTSLPLTEIYYPLCLRPLFSSHKHLISIDEC